MPRRPLVLADGVGRFALWSPCASLTPWVESIWFARGPGHGLKEIVLPNGATEIIFNLGGTAHRVYDGPALHRFRRVWIAGLHDAPLVIGDEGGADLVGIRLRRGAAGGLLGVEAAEVAGRVEEADVGPWRVWYALREQLGGLAAEHDRVEVIEGHLRQWLRHRPEPDRRIRYVLERIARSRCTAGIGALAGELGITHKHLIGMFHHHVGLPPMRLARILRFHRVVLAVQRASPPRWADVAFAHGFADQSHLVREFRTFAGVTPSAFLASRTPDGLHLLR